MASAAEMTVELDETLHLYHNASEVLRGSKGGYLTGFVRLPSVKGTHFVRTSLVPAAVDVKTNPFHLHPNLLHVNKLGMTETEKKSQGTVAWSHVLKIEGDKVLRVYPSPSDDASETNVSVDEEQEAQDRREFGQKLSKFENEDEPLCLGALRLPSGRRFTRLTKLRDGDLELGGSDGLLLNIVSPLRKNSKSDAATITDVLKKRYEDIFGRIITKETLDEVEFLYTKKQDRIKLDQVRLLVEVFNADHELVASSCSEVIINSKSVERGPLRLCDVNPAAACCGTETKIFMLSPFKLAADVRAVFVLYDPAEEKVASDDEYDSLLKDVKQPDAESCKIHQHTTLVFMAPKQNIDIIPRIAELGLQLRVTFFRPSDKKTAGAGFEFRYLKHKEQDCGYCEFAFASSEANLLPKATPGVKRRLENASAAFASSKRGRGVRPHKERAEASSEAEASGAVSEASCGRGRRLQKHLGEGTSTQDESTTENGENKSEKSTSEENDNAGADVDVDGNEKQHQEPQEQSALIQQRLFALEEQVKALQQQQQQQQQQPQAPAADKPYYSEWLAGPPK